MSPKKTKGKIVHTTSSATRTLRNRTIEMAAQLNQSELANLIRTIIREENQAERLVFRSAIREEMSIAIEKVQSQLNAMDVTITQCKEKSAEVDEALSNMNSRITDLEESTTGLQVENTKLKDKIERLEMHSR
jgi:vacuolar-type H+-ATPase subunit I/STV1